MEIWFKLIYIYVLILGHKVQGATTSPCSPKRSPAGTQQITCTNLTSSYFETVGIALNRTIEWFSCDYCDLPMLNGRILNFSTGHLAYINLTKCRIGEIEEAAFKNIPLMKLLMLKGNQLRWLDGGTFRGLSRLLQLDLSQNRLEGLQDDLFVALANLDVLNLNGNRIGVLEPRAFNGLSRLKYLYLNSNDITFVHPYLFKFLTELKILYLEYNKIKEIGQLAFTNLNRLEFLYLNNNSLELLSEYNFKQLPSLVDLQLRNNSLRVIPTSCFNGLRRLKFLYLGNNEITKMQKRGFVGLDDLIVLDLMDNKIHHFSLDLLVDVPKLRALWLEKNGMRNITASRITRRHEHLQSLDLKSNALAYFNYKIVYRKLPALEELVITDNRFKCDFFVPMQDFFEDKNVTLCLDDRCDPTRAASFAEKTCKLGYNATTDGGASFSRKSSTDYLLILAYALYAVNVN